MDPGPMNRKIDLHIGLQKTGSTAIQRFFASNRDRIRADGMLYPIVPGLEQHVGLRLYSQTGPHAYDELNLQMLARKASGAFDKRKFAEAFQAEIEGTAAGHIILSSEHLAYLESENELQTLREFLLPFGRRIDVIVYLRRQDEHFTSDYAQIIKSGGTAHFDQDDVAKWNPLLPSILNFDTLLDRWASVFGADRVNVRVYEREKLVDGDVVIDFLHTARVPHLQRLYRREDHNPSLDRHQVEFLRLFNAEMERRPGGVAAFPRGSLVEAVEASAGPEKVRLPDAKRRELFARYEASNRVVRDRFRPDLKEGLFREPPSSNHPGCFPSLTTEQAVAIGADLWLMGDRHNRELATEVRRLERQLAKAQRKLATRRTGLARLRGWFRRALRGSPNARKPSRA